MASSNNYHVRSASYPPKSNPILQKIEDELMKLRKSEASTTSVSETMFVGLTGLARLYKCVDDVLRMPLLAQPTLLAKPANHFNPIVEGSLKLLEICNASKQCLVRLLEAVRTSLRCSNSSEARGEISRYFCLRKEITKIAKGLVLELRQIEGSLVSEKRELISEEFEVISVLRCVSIINISVLESFLSFLIVSSKGKFGLISKLVAKMSVISEEKLCEKGNELSNVDVVLHAFDGERCDYDVVKKRLQVLEVSLRGIEDGLNNICKQLTRTRASLINIISV